MANVEIIHKNAGHIALSDHHTEQEEFVVDTTEINLSNIVDVELRIYFNNPNMAGRDLLITMNPGSDPAPFTGKPVTAGKQTIVLTSTDFPHTPYDNYLIDYLKENGQLTAFIDLEQSADEIYYLGMDLKIITSSCTGWRRWFCSLLCGNC
ncbi:MAG: hypothetical protein PVJ39_20145 [Gammaproteobacteria bacterium]|jgi:hypothetical protein